MTGLTNGACSDCANANGVPVTLSYNPNISACGWSGTIPICNFGFGPAEVILVYSSSLNKWQLTINNDKEYDCPGASFNCLGPNVFTATNTGASCNNWPATVTLSPA